MELFLSSTQRNERKAFADHFQEVAGLHCTVEANAEMLTELASSWYRISSTETQSLVAALFAELEESLYEARHLDSLVDQALHGGIDRAKPYQLAKASERMKTQTETLNRLSLTLNRITHVGHHLVSSHMAGPSRVSRYVQLCQGVVVKAKQLADEGERTQSTKEQLDGLISEAKRFWQLSDGDGSIELRERLDRIRLETLEAIHQLQVVAEPAVSHYEWGLRILDGIEAEWKRIRQIRSDDRVGFGVKTDDSISDWCGEASRSIELAHSLVVIATGTHTTNRDWEEVSSLLEVAGLELTRADSVLNEAERHLQLQLEASRKAQPLISDLGSMANFLVNLASKPGQDPSALDRARGLQNAARGLSQRLDGESPDHLAIATMADFLCRGASQRLEKLGAPTSVWSSAQLELERTRARVCISFASMVTAMCDSDREEQVAVIELEAQLNELTGTSEDDPSTACRIAEEANVHYWSMIERRQRHLTWIVFSEGPVSSAPSFEETELFAAEVRNECANGLLGGALRAGSFSESGSGAPLRTAPFESFKR